MDTIPSSEAARQRSVITARRGVGPLLQRDYWCVIARCRVGPTHLMTLVTQRFAEFAPGQLVRFAGSEGDLVPGDELDVSIRLAGGCRVTAVGSGAAGNGVHELELQEAGR